MSEQRYAVKLTFAELAYLRVTLWTVRRSYGPALSHSHSLNCGIAKKVEEQINEFLGERYDGGLTP